MLATTASVSNVSEHKTTAFIKRSSMILDSESQDHLNKFASRPGTPPSDFQDMEESQGMEVPHAHLDETLQSLCEFEDGFHLLLSRVKENIASARDASQFLKKRAAIEEEYGKSLLKLAQSSSKPDGKGGSFGDSWKQFLGLHENVASIHLKLSGMMQEISDAILAIQKDTERSRKQLKSAGYQHAKMLQDSENALEKAKSKYEMYSEEWERTIIAREGPSKSLYPPKPLGGLVRSFSMPLTLLKGPNPSAAKMLKYEEDARAKVSSSHGHYKNQIRITNDMRHAYYCRNLPRFIRLLKEANDQCDTNLKANLFHYSQVLEDSLMLEVNALNPVDKENPEYLGLSAILENINNGQDFQDFMGEFIASMKVAPDAALMPLNASDGNRPMNFGVDIIELFEREGQSVPQIVKKLATFIETKGLKVPGLYRESGNTLVAQKLKDALNRDPDFDLSTYSIWTPVDVSFVLKQFFRELPDPLFPRAFYHQFMDAGRMEDPKRRLIAVHELVNRFHDANYATLRYLVKHLYTVQSAQLETRMSCQNLAIVWGPILLDSPDSSIPSKDLIYQTRVIETILNNFDNIFDSE